MSKKAPVPLRVAPLQYVIAEPITGPAEQAALAKSRKREKRRKGGQQAEPSRKDASPVSDSTAKKRG